MKKILGMFVATLVAVLPFTVDAAISIDPNCTTADANNVITCNVVGNFTDAQETSLSVILTEAGGAEIQDVNSVGADWAIDGTASETNGQWVVNLISLTSGTGEVDLFTFTYVASGQEDCKITIKIGDQTKEVTPSVTDPSSDNKDTPTENEQTGATLPYVAAAVIVLVAGGAYVATKNKSKMYKI